MLDIDDELISIVLTVECKNLVAGDRPGAARISDIETGEMTNCLEADGDERAIWAVKFCGEGHWCGCIEAEELSLFCCYLRRYCVTVVSCFRCAKVLGYLLHYLALFH